MLVQCRFGRAEKSWQQMSIIIDNHAVTAAGG